MSRSATLVALMLIACAGPGASPDRASEEEQRALTKANQTLVSDRDAGVEQLTEFLQAWPRSPLADDVAYRLAELALAEGETEQAIHWFYYIVRNHPQQDRSDSARLRLAVIESERGDSEAARELLRRLRFSRLSEEEKRSAYRTLADAAADPVEKLRWLAGIRAAAVEDADEEQIAAVDREIDALMNVMSEEELGRASDQLDRRIPAARVRLHLAERALDAGDFERASKELGRAERLELPDPYGDRLRELKLHLELRERFADSETLPGFAEVATLPPQRTEGAVGTLGVALPLTGRFAEYGEESLRGVLLAARIFDEGDRVRALKRGESVEIENLAEAGAAPSRVRVLVRDTRGTPAGAEQAVEELASHEDVVAIVGPLLSSESEAAAGAAEEARVSLLALTSSEEVAQRRPYVFRLRTTAADEVRYVVDHAFDAFDARRFAILYPADNYGRGMRLEFWRAVERRGGEVVAVSSYDPAATDFAKPIRRMIGYPLLTKQEKIALEERAALLRRARRLPPEEGAVVRKTAYETLGPEGEPLPPIVDFDALFIPDSHDKVVLIAPQLAFHEVNDVRLLGAEEWYHPDLLRIAGGHVRGAVFAVPFHPESRFVFVSRFVERYTTTFGSSPDLFSAQAFDAANLVMVQLAAGLENRASVRDGLLRTQGYAGVSGVTTLLPDGNARKRPYLLGVRQGQIVSLD